MSIAKKARHFSFDVQTAENYGVDEAIMIQNFIFWIEKNLANGKNHHDGRTWTYNTQAAFTFLFPFWSYKQIRRILSSLVNQRVLITGNYNQHSYDRTAWYAFNDESKWLNPLLDMPQDLESIELPKRANATAQMGEWFRPEGRNDTKYINTDTKTDNNNNAQASKNAVQEPKTVVVETLNTDKIALVGLSERQKGKAQAQLSELSPDQQKIAIDSFNKTMATNGVKSSPMALLNGLINLGKENALEAVKTPQATQTPVTTQTTQKTDLELISAYVSRYTDRCLKMWRDGFYVHVPSVGNVTDKNTLILAGLPL